MQGSVVTFANTMTKHSTPKSGYVSCTIMIIISNIMLKTKRLLYLILGIMLKFPLTVYATQVIDGLLIEGLDYSGKTTIANIVKDALEKKNYNIRTGHGQLASSNLSVFLASEGYSSLPSEIPKKFPDVSFMKKKLQLHLASLIVDKMLGNQMLEEYKKKGIFLIQDRYLLTLQCAKKFFIPDLEIPELKMIEGAEIPFKYNIYLTCSPQERKKRAEAREKQADNLEKYLIAHLNELYKYDELCQSMVKEKPRWHIIDTSDRNPNEVANQILYLIQQANNSF